MKIMGREIYQETRKWVGRYSISRKIGWGFEGIAKELVFNVEKNEKPVKVRVTTLAYH